MIKIISKAKKREKEDFYDSLLNQLKNIDTTKVTEVLSNYMDACRSIQRKQQDALRKKQLEGVVPASLIISSYRKATFSQEKRKHFHQMKGHEKTTSINEKALKAFDEKNQVSKEE